MADQHSHEYWVNRIFSHPYPRKLISRQDISILKTGIELIDDDYLASARADDRPIIRAIRELMELELAIKTKQIV